jgi:hypothetical protein
MRGGKPREPRPPEESARLELEFALAGIRFQQEDERSYQGHMARLAAMVGPEELARLAAKAGVDLESLPAPRPGEGPGWESGTVCRLLTLLGWSDKRPRKLFEMAESGAIDLLDSNRERPPQGQSKAKGQYLVRVLKASLAIKPGFKNWPHETPKTS